MGEKFTVMVHYQKKRGRIYLDAEDLLRLCIKAGADEMQESLVDLLERIPS